MSLRFRMTRLWHLTLRNVLIALHDLLAAVRSAQKLIAWLRLVRRLLVIENSEPALYAVTEGLAALDANALRDGPVTSAIARVSCD